MANDHKSSVPSGATPGAGRIARCRAGRRQHPAHLNPSRIGAAEVERRLALCPPSPLAPFAMGVLSIVFGVLVGPFVLMEAGHEAPWLPSAEELLTDKYYIWRGRVEVGDGVSAATLIFA